MAVTSHPETLRPRQNFIWSRLHFFIRLLGTAGLLAAWISDVLNGVVGQLAARFEPINSLNEGVEAARQLVQVLVNDPRGHQDLLVFFGGAAAVLLALCVELFASVLFTAFRRGAFGVNAVLQATMAAALLIGVNVWSYFHYQQFDGTRDRQFTLPEEDRANLAKLDPKSKTTVIIYNVHRTFGQFTKKPDQFESAAAAKIVEKVRDLADRLRAIGPQLQVELLDVDQEGYEKSLDALTRDAPQLRKAIDAAQENSLFFFARGEDGRENIQQFSFNDFYLLDKTASQGDGESGRNLVLLSQGVKPFVRRILSLGAPKPRVGIAVIHEVLTSTGEDELGLQGLRKVLEENGFEVRDILLKRWGNTGPEAAVYTSDENTLDELEQQERSIKTVTAAIEQNQKEIREAQEVWKKAVVDEKMRDELTRKLASRLRGRKITVALARDQVEGLEDDLKSLDAAAQRLREQLDEINKQKSGLNVTALSEQRRMTDLKAKLDRLLSECDVLIVPRMTLRNTAARGANISAQLYRMEQAQVDAIKDYLKAGKPLLACVGPDSEAPEERSPESGRPEPFETMLSQLGIKLGKQTVLFDVETKAFADRRAGKMFAGSTVRIPPVLFDWKSGQGHPLVYPPLSTKENPIRRSLRLATRGLGKGKRLDVSIRVPQPVYYEPIAGVKPEFDPDFLMTDADSWNEDQPFPTADSIPQFARPKESGDGDKSKGTLEERRRGPFPIGVAVQTKLPTTKEWYSSASDVPAAVRLAVIGQGGFFTGKELPPAQEKLFVNTLNWLLGRDDQLATEEKVWSYPRVNETIPPNSPTLDRWKRGMQVDLPALFIFIGVVVALVRRLR
jgi:hypothetical protein